MSDGFEGTVAPSFFARYAEEHETVQKALPSFSLDPDYSVKQGAFEFYLRYGGYLTLTDESLSDADRREWLYTYVRTFLERDVRDLGSFRDLELFILL